MALVESSSFLTILLPVFNLLAIMLTALFLLLVVCHMWPSSLSLSEVAMQWYQCFPRVPRYMSLVHLRYYLFTSHKLTVF